MIEVLGVGIAAVAAYIAYLQLQHHRRSDLVQSSQEVRGPSVPIDWAGVSRRSVTFEPSNQVWTPPTPNELGIPLPLSYVFSISTPLKQGDVVERGDPLIVFELATYKGFIPKGILKHLLPENVTRKELVLRSPISGIVLGHIEVPARKSAGIYRGMIHSTAGTYPFLLAAKGETAWDEIEVQRLQRSLIRALRHGWRRNWHMCAIKNEDYPDTLYDAVSDGSFWKIGPKSSEEVGTQFLSSFDEVPFLAKYKTRTFGQSDVGYLEEVCHKKPDLAVMLNNVISPFK